ncbi:MAG TPA: hypothetical protein VF725_07960 [Ktedonobacterales bacterium]
MLAIFPVLALILLGVGRFTGNDAHCFGVALVQCAQPSHLATVSIYSIAFYSSVISGLLIILMMSLAQQWVVLVVVFVVLGVLLFVVSAWIWILCISIGGLISALIGIAVLPV